MKDWIPHQGAERTQRCAMRVTLAERRVVRESRMCRAARTSTRIKDTLSTGTALYLRDEGIIIVESTPYTMHQHWTEIGVIK